MKATYRIKPNYGASPHTHIAVYNVYLGGSVVYTGSHGECRKYVEERTKTILS